ncbi:MAG: hypothetical protein GW936_08735 [Gallionella sp.]|nr:hypothetical protein [Gallionella sp.]
MRKLKLKHVIFTGRDQAEASAAWSHWAAISITQPGEHVDIKDGWHSVLRLHFHDIDTPEEPYTLFSDQLANEIIDFVERVADCQAGISRSAAIAKWIAERCGLGFPEKYMLYNKHVYRTLREAACMKDYGDRNGD